MTAKKQSFNLPRIMGLRDKIFDTVSGYAGITPEGKEFDMFVSTTAKALPLDIEYQTLYKSLSYLIGVELSSKMLVELCWRLAGNLQRLRNKQPVLPWMGQPAKETVPVQVLEATKTTSFNGGLAYQYRMRILAGTSCPIVMHPLWTLNMVKYVASKIGFSKAWKEHPFRDGHELVGMRFLVDIDPEYCRNSQPGFWHIGISPSLIKWNKELLMARAHISPPCPMNFTHHCYACPVGYRDCIAGTHPNTYVKQACETCKKETWHDPANNACIVCIDRKEP